MTQGERTMTNNNASALEAELIELLSEIQSAAKILRRLEKMGVLTIPDGANRSTFCFRRWHKERGNWVGVWIPFATIESHTEYPPQADLHRVAPKSVVDGVRFGEDVASPGKMLAKLIEKHRDRMKSIHTLSETENV